MSSYLVFTAREVAWIKGSQSHRVLQNQEHACWNITNVHKLSALWNPEISHVSYFCGNWTEDWTRDISKSFVAIYCLSYLIFTVCNLDIRLVSPCLSITILFFRMVEKKHSYQYNCKNEWNSHLYILSIIKNLCLAISSGSFGKFIILVFFSRVLDISLTCLF